MSTSDRFVEPTAARPDGDRPLTDDHVTTWRSQGFALVDGVLPAELVATLQAGAEAQFPAPGSDASEQITVQLAIVLFIDSSPS